MRKTFILAIALSLVLVSGGLASAQDCGCLNPCGWHFPSLCNINWNPCNINWNPCNWHFPSCFCGQTSHAGDIDKPVAHKVGNGSIAN